MLILEDLLGLAMKEPPWRTALGTKDRPVLGQRWLAVVLGTGSAFNARVPSVSMSCGLWSLSGPGTAGLCSGNGETMFTFS